MGAIARKAIADAVNGSAMASGAQRAAATGLLLIASPAWASGATGYLTFVVGVPTLLVATAALVLMSRRPRARSSVIACIGLLAIPVSYDLLLVSDALSLFRHGARIDAGIAIAFFSLLALVCWLGVRLVRRSAARR